MLGISTGRQTGAPVAAIRLDDVVRGWTFAYLIAIWVVRDARRLDRSIGYGFPSLVFLMPPVFGPLYLFQTRGAKAVLSVMWFVMSGLFWFGIGVFLGSII